jgi:hypothetical protein
MGAKIDRAGISLEETLEPEGKKVLRDLATQKIFISTWRRILFATRIRRFGVKSNRPGKCEISGYAESPCEKGFLQGERKIS